MANLSKSDVRRINNYKKRYEYAKSRGDKAGMARAHSGAESVRSKYGYSGGADGSKNIKIGDSSRGSSSGRKSSGGSSGKSKTSSNVSSSSSNKFTGNLFTGSSGNSVKQVQSTLKNLGYDVGSIDGIFGKKTKSAVTQYQKDKGLTVDGIVGKQTYSSLNNSASSGSSGSSSTTSGIRIKYPDGNYGVGYIKDNKTYLQDGSRVPVGSVVQAKNGKYYQLTNNGGVEVSGEGFASSINDISETPEQEPDLSSQEGLEDYLQELTKGQMEPQAMYDLIMSMMPKTEQQKVLSYDEALSRASSNYNGLYDKNIDRTMKAMDKNALKRGFFGQLPTESLKREAVSGMEAERSAAINNLAQQLVGQSEENAMKQEQLGLQQQSAQMNTLVSALQGYANANNTSINNILQLIGLKQGQQEYEDSRKDTEFTQNLALKEFELNKKLKLQELGMQQAQISDMNRRTNAYIEDLYKQNQIKDDKEAQQVKDAAIDLATKMYESGDIDSPEEFWNVVKQNIKSIAGDDYNTGLDQYKN